MAILDGTFQLDLNQRQLELLRHCRKRDGLRKIILLNGPRYSSKTIGALNAFVDHAWNTKGACVNILVPTITAGTDSGVWTILTDKIIPQWIEGDFGLEWATRGTPRQHGVTKKFYCLIKNKFGGTSRFEVNSLKDERRVEDDFKNRYFSGIYWSELSNYKYRKTFDTLIHGLRMMGVPEDEHLMICDTNPADEGEDSWIYKLFYLKENEPEAFRKTLHLIEFTLDDNTYLSDRRKQEIRDSFRYDPDLYARMAEGKWTKAAGNSLFADVFKHSIHVIGGDGPDPEIIVPEEDCIELSTGWDFGWANPAAVFAEKVFRYVPQFQKEMAVFKFFDELCFLKGEVTVADFTEAMLEKIDKWEGFLGRKIMWHHWSDRSAFDMLEPISNRYQYEEVFAASEGRIRLDAVDRRPGSVAQRIRLWRKLLYQQRLIFCKTECPKLVEMNQAIQRGSTQYSIAKNSEHKHPFDAASYLVSRECYDELQEGIMALRTLKNPVPKLISIPL